MKKRTFPLIQKAKKIISLRNFQRKAKIIRNRITKKTMMDILSNFFR